MDIPCYLKLYEIFDSCFPILDPTLDEMYTKPDELGHTLTMPEKITRLTKNAAECTNCGARIQSKTRHDFQTCDCWDTDPNHGIFIDGGLSYHRCGYRNEYDYVDKCEYEDVDD